jgi:hypothetical protein
MDLEELVGENAVADAPLEKMTMIYCSRALLSVFALPESPPVCMVNSRSEDSEDEQPLEGRM